MSTNVVNNMPYLRTSREFPEEMHQLTVEVNKSYVDVANAVNNRTISIFPVNTPAITGESYFLANNQRIQTFRQVYPFGAISAGSNITINHNIKNLKQFTRVYGTCITDQPDYRPIPYASIAANFNIDLRVTHTTTSPYGTIVISVGAGSPNVISGLIILEWY